MQRDGWEGLGAILSYLTVSHRFFEKRRGTSATVISDLLLRNCVERPITYVSSIINFRSQQFDSKKNGLLMEGVRCCTCGESFPEAEKYSLHFPCHTGRTCSSDTVEPSKQWQMQTRYSLFMERTFGAEVELEMLESHSGRDCDSATARTRGTEG